MKAGSSDLWLLCSSSSSIQSVRLAVQTTANFNTIKVRRSQPTGAGELLLLTVSVPL